MRASSKREVNRNLLGRDVNLPQPAAIAVATDAVELLVKMAEILNTA